MLEVLTTKLMPIILYFLIGYVLKVLKILKKEEASILIKLVFYLMTPAVIISSMSTMKFTGSLIYYPISAICIHIFMYFFTLFIANRLNINEKEKVIFRGSTLIMNMTFVLPFFIVFFGEKNVYLLSLFDAGNLLMVTTVVYSIFITNSNGVLDKLKSVLKSPLIIALIIGGIYAFSMIFQSTEVVMRMNGAREVTEEQAPQLYHIVQDMAMVAQIPMPRVYIVDDPSMNAFATGSHPQNAAVAATTGLLAVMNREELEGVIGHEVSHIRNYDIRISTIAVALASAITMLSSIGGRMMWWGGGRSRDDDREGSSGLEIIILILSLLAIVLAPLAATLVQLAISRQREFLADASSVELTRNPQGMINALLKLDNSEPMQRHVDDASSALFINDPKKESGLQKLFYTHPPIAERVARLRKM